MKRDELLTKLAMELGEWDRYEVPTFNLPCPWCWAFVGDGEAYARKNCAEFIVKDEWLTRRAELINKPSWDSAPGWATHLAQDCDEDWIWFKGEPTIDEDGEWIPPNGLSGKWKRSNIGRFPAGHDWRQTLERRPQASQGSPDVDNALIRHGEEGFDKYPHNDTMRPHGKYHREIKPGVFVDVYDVLAAWGVKNPALQHLIKKALQPGERGHKNREQDMDDIVASAKRAKELEG